jgi:hypothetical protein
MKIVAHCFADNASITPTKMGFEFKGYDANIFSMDDKLILQISKVISSDELLPFSEKINSSTETIEIVEDKFEVRLRPYKLVLTEAAQLFEGLFSLMYATIPPHFDTGRINLNLYSQTEVEQKMLDEGTIARGGGYVIMPEKKNYKIDNSIYDLIAPSIKHIPSFSFFSHALRSLKSNDNEVAFFLFFRILDGYFSFGATAVKKEFLKKETQLSRFIPYEPKLINSLKNILTSIGLPSESEKDFKGLLSDIVLVRHKLTHFSSAQSQTHHSPTIKFELVTVNAYLYSCCFNLLREKITPQEAI